MSNKNKLDRRDFIKYLSLGALFSTIPLSSKVSTTPHVVVVGAGFAGSTCAKYLKLWGGNSINVTIIEPNSVYVSPILSNLVLNNQRTTNQLSFTYDKHINSYQINMVYKSVLNIDTVNKELVLSDNSRVKYDKVILAPGIDFIKTNNYDFTKVPHAWIAGEQTNILKRQIDSMVDGDDFVMTIPKSPYRCPPGPYERACIVADYLKNIKGFTNSRVILLDENSDIIVEKQNFQNVFNAHGVDYRPNCKVTHVDDTNKTLTYTEGSITGKTITAKVLNVIPNQKAAKIIFDTGLTGGGNFAPINLLSYESTIKNDIHIIGDSHHSSQPKAGHIGNSEAKICADAVLRILSNNPLYQNPKTNSACYSPTSSTEASWLNAVYKYDAVNNNMVLVDSSYYPKSSPSSTYNYKEMFKWSENLFADTFS